MVRKIIAFMIVMLLMAGATCTAISAATHNIYDGQISSTQLTYFKDILAGVDILDNYVAFRSEQYEYTMVVGDLDFTNGVFKLNEPGRVYTINTNSSYNSNYSYSYASIDNFSLNVNDNIIYSDLGNYPQLEDRGAKYEILQTIIIAVIGLCFVIRSIFTVNRRR